LASLVYARLDDSPNAQSAQRMADRLDPSGEVRARFSEWLVLDG